MASTTSAPRPVRSAWATPSGGDAHCLCDVVAAHLVAGPEVGHRWERRAAVITSKLATRVEEAPVRPAAGQGGVAGNSDDGSAMSGTGAAVWRRAEKIRSRTTLDDPPAVHDRHAVGELGHDGEVVADIERRDAMERQRSRTVSSTRACRDVQAGRRFIADDHLRAVGECHRDRDALLLAAGELVRVAVQEGVVGGQRHLVQRLARTLRTLLRCFRRACASRISMIWVPIRSAGFSAVPGSCGM